MSIERSPYDQDRGRRRRSVLKALWENPQGLTADEVCRLFPHEDGRLATLESLYRLRKRALILRVSTLFFEGDEDVMEVRYVATHHIKWAI